MITAPPTAAADWVDPLYRTVDRLPHTGTEQRFAGVDAEVSVIDTAPDTVGALWLPERAIVVMVDDRTAATDLARALPSFRAYAGALGGQPSVAMITVPSADIDRCRVVRADGFAPSMVVQACALTRSPLVPGVLPAGVTIHPAGPADAAAIAELWLAQAAYAARIGSVRVTPGVVEAMRRSVPALIGGPQPALVAVDETDGRVVAAIVVGATGAAAGHEARLNVEAAGYLAVASTAPGLRGRGIGAALAREVHRELARAGVAAAAVHHSPFNPLAGAFWARHGYRPLLTTFVRAL